MIYNMSGMLRDTKIISKSLNVFFHLFPDHSIRRLKKGSLNSGRLPKRPYMFAVFLNSRFRQYQFKRLPIPVFTPVRSRLISSAFSLLCFCPCFP